MLARRYLRVNKWLYNAAVANGRQVVGCRSILRRPNVRLQTVTLKSLATSPTSAELSPADYEKICDATLESLYEYFELLVESHSELKGGDVTYSDGVLTVNLGPNGTYVINRQSPNKQIWLSSPRSGPKRYDFVQKSNCWVYKRDDVSMHELLSNEMTAILSSPVDFWKCEYSGKKSSKDLRECYTQLQQVNSDLLRSYALRSANHNEILATLRNINNIIQNAARLRVGRNKNEIAQQCRLAVANNNVNALIKIIKTGEI